MNTAGWIVMSISILTVVLLTLFCFYKIITDKGHSQHGTIDIDTHDKDDE